MKISSFSIRHPAIIIIVGIAVLIFGTLSLTTLNQEFLPNVSLPSIVVIAQYPGVEAEVVEDKVTKVLEDSMIVLQGLQSIDSQSMNSVSVITLEFSENIDAYEVLPEVRASIDRVKAELPDDLDGEPYAFVGGSGMLTIYSFAVISDRDPDLLYRFVEDEIVPSIARIPGTAQVSTYGGREKQVKIELGLEKMENLGVSVLDVYTVLNASNVSLPIGEAVYRDSSIYMQVEGEFSTLDELRDLVIGHHGESFIHLSDVADISLTYQDPELYIDVGSGSAIVVDVTKRDDGNTMEISRAITHILEQYGRQYEGVISFEVIQDDSDMIGSSLNTTINSGLLGALMAVVVIFLFLGNIRATLIIGLSIPLSIVFSFIGMKFAGQTVNILSLSGLIVALGMVVDSSIVILENIFRYERDGHSVLESAETGANEVGGAVFASGATTIAVFIPLLFLTGIIGIIMTDVSLTIIFALAASLLVSMVIVPFLASHLHIKGLLAEDRDSGLNRRRARRNRRIGEGMTHLERGYKRILSWSLRHRFFVILLSVIILVISVGIISILGVVFIPSADTGDFYIYMKFPQGYTLEQSHKKVLEIQQMVEDMIPEAQQTTFFTGFSSEYSRSFSKANKAYGKVILNDSTERDRGVKEIIKTMQFAITETVPDIDVVVENGGFDKLLAIATGGSGFQIELAGNDLDTLYRTAVDVRRRLEQDPEIYKATVDVQQDQESLITDLALDHMGRLGISSYEAAVTARILFNGIDIGTYQGDPRYDYPILLTSDIADQPVRLNTLERIAIPSQTGDSISFANFSSQRLDDTISTIRHKDRMKAITVTGYAIHDDTTEIRSRMEGYLESGGLPPTVDWSITGTSSLLTNSFTKLLLVLLISIFLVYMVMVIQFERFVQPLIIMTSVPFCVIGVVLGLLIFGSDMSLIAFLGIIALGGIVVNNAIVLIDRINRGREEELHDRIVQGASTRLRPILMTTLTTFFGVLPMALSSGGGSEIYAPLGQAIAGGLLSSTLITLVLIPVLYFTIEQRRRRNEEID